MTSDFSVLHVIFELLFFFFQAEDGIRDGRVTGVQTCALPIFAGWEPTRTKESSAPVSNRARLPLGAPTFCTRAGAGDTSAARAICPDGIERRCRKIGRASCRGRGENSGGAGSIKKKERREEGG